MCAIYTVGRVVIKHLVHIFLVAKTLISGATSPFTYFNIIVKRCYNKNLQLLPHTLLEKMAHFSSVVTYGAGRSSQWAKPFVIFSSSG
jgi:hypothetical protein